MNTKKKLMILLAATALTACGNKTKSVANKNNPMATEQIAVMPGAKTTDIANRQNEKAVEAFVRKCYAKVNEMGNSENGIDISKLDSMFCTKDYLELQAKVWAISRTKENPEEYFTDEGYHWLPDIGTPITIDSIHVAMLPDNAAAADVWLQWNGKTSYLELELRQEQGQWKIQTWVDSDVYPFGSLWHWMWNYAEGNTDDTEEEEDE